MVDAEALVAEFETGLPFALDPFQREAMLALAGGQSVLVAAPTGTGKALASTTPVLTPTGWTPIRDLRPGDIIIGARGRPITVLGVYPQGRRPAYRVTFTDGVSVICDLEHLWAVNTKWRRYAGLPWCVRTLKQILDEGLSDGQGWRHFIPMVEPVALQQPEAPVEDLPPAVARRRAGLTQRALAVRMGVSQGAIAFRETGRRAVTSEWRVAVDGALAEVGPRPRLSPYVLGLLLGDGGLSTGMVRFSSADDDLVAALMRLIPSEVTLIPESSRPYDWQIVSNHRRTRNPVIETMRELGLLGHRAEGKFIPHEYKWAPIADRIALLHGLFDTDGSIDSRGIVEYCTVSPVLAEDVAFLVRSLGGRASIRRKSTGFQTAYRLFVSLPGGIAPFTLRRKLERYTAHPRQQPCRSIRAVEPVAEVDMTCIAVDAADGLFVVDGFVVTHNTVVAEFAVHLAHQRGLRALYTAPIKALSNQKYRDLRERYGDAVGLLTGDLVLQPDASIQVMTTEVLRNRLVQGTDRLDDVGAIVFDEVHYMGDPERGTAWEEAILLAPRHVPLICLSATVPNADEIANWLRDAHGHLACVFHDERAVPLEVRYFLEGHSHLVLDAAGRRHTWLGGVGGELTGRVRWSGHGDGGGDGEPHALPPPWQVVRHLESQELTPAIYFLFGRRACEQAAASCAALKPVPHANQLVQDARLRLAALPPEDRDLRQVALLFRLLPRGVAVHHAGLLPPIKLLVEEFFAAGRLRAVFATDTLALGINMPARTVVIGEMTKWDGEQRRLLTPNEFRQMAGRAGRRGIDARGVALVLYSPWVTFEKSMEIAQGELLPLESAFRPSYSTTINLWRGPADEDRLAELYARSLRRFQHDRRLSHLAEMHDTLQDRFETLEAQDLTDPATWTAARDLARSEHALNRARALASREARTVVEGLVRVLERFGYLSERRPSAKAAYLRGIFDNNALTLAELLAGRYLEPLEPAEIAEVASWFSWDRDTPLNALPIPPRLHRLRADVGKLHGSVLAEEKHRGVEVSRPLYDEFRGVALAWAEGRALGDIASRTRIAEGDLVGHFQKTIDLLGQLRAAARRGAAAPAASEATARRRERAAPVTAARGRERATPTAPGTLLERLEQADALLRHGVVAASYRWAIEGPPDDADEEALNWVPRPLPDEHDERRSLPPRGPGRGRAGRKGTRGGDKPRAKAGGQGTSGRQDRGGAQPSTGASTLASRLRRGTAGGWASGPDGSGGSAGGSSAGGRSRGGTSSGAGTSRRQPAGGKAGRRKRGR